MIKISHLYTYPVKSLQATASNQLTLGDRGPVGDRSWMMVDSDQRAVTLREEPRLVDFSCAIEDGQLVIRHLAEKFVLDEASASHDVQEVQLFSKPYLASAKHDPASQWISERLKRSVSLVKAPIERPVRTMPEYHVNFPDSSQYLVLSQASLDLLTEKTGRNISPLRFRPNIVVDGAAAHAEDLWKIIKIGSDSFSAHKLCGRCKVITIDPSTGDMDLSVLSTLGSYRKIDRKICLGVYFLRTSKGPSQLTVGDEVSVID